MLASEPSEQALQKRIIFMPQKCENSVWPIATPSAIIVNTVYIILVV